jgi:hydrogenase-1 operon protein HyaF
MKNRELPVISGRGSQPVEADGAQLEYIEMPGAMSTFAMPNLPEVEEVAGLEQGKAILEELLVQLSNYAKAPADALEVGCMNEANRQLVDQVLGEGEVSIIYSGSPHVKIQESVLAGVWRVHYFDDEGRLIRDVIEVGDIPGWIRHQTFSSAACRLSFPQKRLSAEVSNSPPILAEIDHHCQQADEGGVPHVINLTLLPLTEQDLIVIQQTLGEGRVTILSRGYGNCRITSTNTRNVWWVQYFNSQDRIILNTIEITSVPVVACAALEDIEDSAERLGEILEIYR